MVLEILCVEPIYPQYSGVLETCLALSYWFFEVLGSKSVRRGIQDFHMNYVLVPADIAANNVVVV